MGRRRPTRPGVHRCAAPSSTIRCILMSNTLSQVLHTRQSHPGLCRWSQPGTSFLRRAPDPAAKLHQGRLHLLLCYNRVSPAKPEIMHAAYLCWLSLNTAQQPPRNTGRPVACVDAVIYHRCLPTTAASVALPASLAASAAAKDAATHARSSDCGMCRGGTHPLLCPRFALCRAARGAAAASPGAVRR